VKKHINDKHLQLQDQIAQQKTNGIIVQNKVNELSLKQGEISKFFEERGNLIGLGMAPQDKDDEALNELQDKLKEVKAQLAQVKKDFATF